SDAPLEDWHLDERRFLNCETHLLLVVFIMQQAGLDHVGDRTWRLLAESERLHESPLAQAIFDPRQQFGRADLTAMEKEQSLHKQDQGEDAQHEEQPHNRAASFK